MVLKIIDKIAWHCSVLPSPEYKTEFLVEMFRKLYFYDRETGEHSCRVGESMERIALLPYFHGVDLRLMALGGYFHDIGKIKTPKSLLRKKRGFGSEEMDMPIMRNHPLNGAGILEGIDMFLQMLVQRSHTLQDNPYPNKDNLVPYREMFRALNKERDIGRFDRTLIALTLCDHADAPLRGARFQWNGMNVTHKTATLYLQKRFPQYAGLIEQIHSAGIF